MLAGLIFAIEEAEDRPGTLAATLPFGGMTLLEYQVRLLAGVGAERVLVAVGQMPPVLIAAVNRAAKRGVPVEIVRSAEEASEKVDPNSHVLVIADGLVTTDPVIEHMAAEEGEVLLVTADPNSPSAIERVDMRDSWAGIARVTGEQLGEIAQMPADYDFQSALLRVAVQAGASHAMLTRDWERSGHLVVLDSRTLATRSNVVLTALTERRTNWADRFVFTGLARLVLARLTERGVPEWALTIAGGVTGLASLVAIPWGWEGIGLAGSVVAALLFATGAALAALVGESKRAGQLELTVTVMFAAAVLSVGGSQRLVTGEWTPLVLALAIVGCQILVERAPVKQRRWWASPAAHLLLLTPFALASYAEAGLAILAAYAFTSLAAAVEASREKA
jgi:hypothetical protein